MMPGNCISSMPETTAPSARRSPRWVLKRNGRIYHGADAIHALAAISCPHGIFNRQNRWLFRSHNVAARLYPVLRACRNLLLKLLGRHRINNLNIPGNDRF